MTESDGTHTTRPTVAVIGGGASGMMAAGTAAAAGARVTLYERGHRCGRKLAITGKGRCNVTNNCDISEFLLHVPRNPKFLYASLSKFTPADTMSFFESLGVPLKTERGRRVFPVSDRSHDIVDALIRYCRTNGVSIVNKRVTRVVTEDGAVRGIEVGGQFIPYDRVIVACGGLSYPTTGSDGDGYRFAREAGLKVTDTLPSLVPLEAGEPCATLAGLTLKNVKLTTYETEKSSRAVFSELGEMLFTHFGISGPLVLSASARMGDVLPGKYTASIDLKPGLNESQLDTRILSDFAKYINRDMINACADLLPSALVPVVLNMAGIDERKKCNTVTREERRALVMTLKGFKIPILRKRPIEEAVITSGGVDVRCLNPRTMEAKTVSGLYFCGEVIDVDAYTGGYNLQIAFSTGRAAGKAAAAAKS